MVGSENTTPISSTSASSSSSSASSSNKERPVVFIPPRKRQTNKKNAAVGGPQNPQNYVDHIVTIQGRNKLSPTSPNIENQIVKTSVILLYNNNNNNNGVGDSDCRNAPDDDNNQLTTMEGSPAPLHDDENDCFPIKPLLLIPSQKKHLQLQNLIIDLNKFTGNFNNEQNYSSPVAAPPQLSSLSSSSSSSLLLLNNNVDARNSNLASSTIQTTTTKNFNVIMNGGGSRSNSLNVTPTASSYSDENNLIALKALNTVNKSTDCLTTTTTTTTDATPDDELEMMGVVGHGKCGAASSSCIINSSSTTTAATKKRVNICTDITFDNRDHHSNHHQQHQHHQKKSIHYKDIESGDAPTTLTNSKNKRAIYDDDDDDDEDGEADHDQGDESNPTINNNNNNYQSIIIAGRSTKSLNYNHGNSSAAATTGKIEPTRSETYLTMTGTIKRGRKKGQSVDLQLNISREELEKINAAALNAMVDTRHSTINKHKRNLCFYCTPTTGMHIFLLSLLCLPFVMIGTGIYSFYIGTITWYNMFNYFNEEKTYLHKLFMSPLLILTYPIVIVLCTIGLGVYAGFIQISYQLQSWLNEIADVEKGFYGWLCSFLHLSDCSPYEVVILTDLTGGTASDGNDNDNHQHQHQQQHGNSSTEELSL